MKICLFHENVKFPPAGLVIFDRDGTLIENIKGLKSVSDIVWKPGRLSLIKELTDVNYAIAIATNQGAVEEGLISEGELERVHNKIASDIYETGGQIWAIAYCPHGKNQSGMNCPCRKPKPGMLDKLISNFMAENLPLFYIGDSETDMLAAQSSKNNINYLDANQIFESSRLARDWIIQ